MKDKVGKILLKLNTFFPTLSAFVHKSDAARQGLESPRQWGYLHWQTEKTR